jgi:two-component system chemotaxis response regulator CheY
MKSILIIDDASTVRLYHRSLLEEAGFAVDEAINGIEGIEKALSKSYDLFVVDVNMPKMDGYTFLREIRKRKDVHQAPAVMVSTEAEERDRQRAYTAGANFYIVKPTKPDELLQVALMMTGGRA